MYMYSSCVDKFIIILCKINVHVHVVIIGSFGYFELFKNCVLCFCFSASCFNGSTCVNIPGAFTCNCPSGRFGDACEFDHENCVCPETYTCIELEGAPSQCTSAPSSGLMIVQDPVPGNTAVLDQVISTLTEDEPVSNS